MQNLKNEKVKKILVALVVLALFGASYVYYAGNGKKTKQVIKPVKVVKNIDKKEQKVDKKEQKTDAKETKTVVKGTRTKQKQTKNVIKPTNKKDLIANAIKMSGKNDPFSYIEIRQAAEPVIIKGFMGNKVIAEVKGFTELLAVNESLNGIKVLSIDPATLTCNFEVEGKRVKKTMKPITRQDSNVDINRIYN